ncbi:hypothetical protein GGP41_001986 [Bipolaris sorokiniana]|uniref:Mitochondrial inner membrane protease subunit n=2 Tax=Cochliobolus sativus TaxID=45130 RepID=A0A8H5ZNB6_COCSA|nr:uncharacterized protein COCSADRAFT_221586 [Bipolaris sorokiniana ND90Pr]EMD62500.1 hypothetical protein COCSADRAFT_221586 [Bipolaris sorokiniana ND90Pr]KAF5853421.1 hypothetical protein GGP41_001986 [Bipolaris sorokiniana]
MPPKPPARLPPKPRVTPKAQVKTSLPGLTPRPAARAPPHPKSTIPATPSNASTPLPPPPPSKWSEQSRSGSSSRYVKWGTNGLVAICAMLFLRDHYIEFQHVRGSSMSPTLSPNAHETGREDYVLVRPYLEHSRRGAKSEQNDNNEWSVKRGDVVTFWKPHKPSEMGIKRVVAVEGDTVYPVRGYAFDPAAHAARVQGSPDGLADFDPDSVVPEAQQRELGKVVVPYGHVWIEGDNWRKSLDSNDFGPISKGLIQGRAVKVWRNWFGLLDVGDERKRGERRMRSRVVEGRSEIPAVFLE